VDVNAQPEPFKSQGPPIPDSAAADAVFVQVRAANVRLMERTPFAIHDVGDEEDESEDELEGEDDDQVMDGVRFILWKLLLGLMGDPCLDAFLEAHDSGLTEADEEWYVLCPVLYKLCVN
jgi:hypothetical protein